MQDHFNIIRNSITREIVLSMLCGDIENIERMLYANNNQPMPIGETDSYQLAYALYDAFRFDKDKSRIYTQRVNELLQLHKAICQPQERTYCKCLYYNSPMTPYYNEDEYKNLKENNIADIDIALMDKGLEFDESAVVELLSKGACPYYVDRSDVLIGKDGKPEYEYEYGDLAPLINSLSEEMFYWWQESDYDKIKNPKTESNETLSSAIEDIINVAANHRMLYIIDSNITKEARDKGVQLMSHYLGHVFPIMDYEP